MHDPNEATTLLIAEIHECLENSKFIIKYERHIKLRNDWVTKAIMISCKKKEQLYNKCAQNQIMID